MKLIIDIPEKALDVLKNDGVDWLGAEHILGAVSKGIPYEERPQGKWKNAYADGFLCSECFLHNNNYTKFCPNCGADMRGDEE